MNVNFINIVSNLVIIRYRNHRINKKMTNVTSPARERHICQDNDYFKERNVPDGFSAKRTNESGIFECMVDPGLPKDQSFVRFRSTNQNLLTSNSTMTLSERNKSSSLIG